MTQKGHFASGDSADVRPPDTRLLTRGVELHLRGWNLEQDLREAGSSSGAPPELSPIKRCCSGARPAKTARMQRKTTVVTLTAAAMPHRHRSYEDNFVNRQSQELARLSLTEERDEGEVEMASAEASATLPSRKATVIFAGGTVEADRFLLDNFATTAAATGDINDDKIVDISKVTSATENMEVEPPATAGRRRLKNCGRRSSAKPRGRVRKATGDTGAKRGPTRQARAAAEAFDATAAAAATPLRTGYGGRVKSETAEEVPLESVTAESESTIEQQADMYVSKIVPDPATVAYPEQGSVPAASCSDHAYDSCEEPPTPPPHRRHGGRTPRPTPVRRRRRGAVDGDERVVCKPQSGRWSSLLPLGTVVRRPSVKLVQLVAQAIHESPHRMLRVTHVYAALQNRYPYYRLQDKKGISSWKIPRGLPRLFLPTDDEGEQRDDEASTLWSGLHVNTEPPSKTTTALMPSVFRLQRDHDLLAPPEPQSPGGKRKLSTVQGSEFAPVTSAAQSEDDLVSVGSPPPSLPHIPSADLWKTESMNLVGWPAPGKTEKQALQQPSVSASAAPPSVWDGMYFQPLTAPPCSTTTTTPLTATMASQPTAAAMVEAVLDRPQKPWQLLSGEPLMQRELHEQQQEPPQQQQQLLNILQAPLQESQEEQQQEQELQLRLQTFGDVFMEHTTQQVGVLEDSLNLLEAGDEDEPLAPLPLLCSPAYVTMTSLTQRPLTTEPSTRAPTPPQQPPVIPGPSEPPQEQAGNLENILGGYGLLTADDE
ncbi:hypothetical protein HPB49_007186 [Dermacentor silvarum]|uniref:Uncharacterized protein n=1 Tax=Dermacentor silvarum TaxID=543639 RepID=A0ACB8DX46_DERSI|nr:hypothetical protein HPB49_007186 [Dermacentor silvarum]